ncbi:MAG: hypothetical protein AAF850_13045 [Pseudomonadota bacterium]
MQLRLFVAGSKLDRFLVSKTTLASLIGLIAVALAQPGATQDLAGDGVSTVKHRFIATAANEFRCGDEVFRLADIAPFSLDDPSQKSRQTEDGQKRLQAFLDKNLISIDKVGYTDRWGRTVIYVYYTDKIVFGLSQTNTNDGGGCPLVEDLQGPTLQDRLVSAGAVMVAPETEYASQIRQLLVYEWRAHKALAGGWAAQNSLRLAAKEAEGAIGRVSIVCGEALSVADIRGRMYINFGEDYREDFTITLRSADFKKWRRQQRIADISPGDQLCARGFVLWINGPSITVDHPQQIERRYAEDENYQYKDTRAPLR